MSPAKKIYLFDVITLYQQQPETYWLQVIIMFELRDIKIKNPQCKVNFFTFSIDESKYPKHYPLAKPSPPSLYYVVYEQPICTWSDLNQMQIGARDSNFAEIMVTKQFFLSKVLFCVFWPAKGCSAWSWLVEIICFCVKISFFIFICY